MTSCGPPAAFCPERRDRASERPAPIIGKDRDSARSIYIMAGFKTITRGVILLFFGGTGGKKREGCEEGKKGRAARQS